MRVFFLGKVDEVGFGGGVDDPLDGRHLDRLAFLFFLFLLASSSTAAAFEGPTGRPDPKNHKSD